MLMAPNWKTKQSEALFDQRFNLLRDFYAADAELPDPVLRVDHVTPPEGPVPLLDVGRVRGGLRVEHDELLAARRLRSDQVHPYRLREVPQLPRHLQEHLLRRQRFVVARPTERIWKDEGESQSDLIPN